MAVADEMEVEDAEVCGRRGDVGRGAGTPEVGVTPHRGDEADAPDPFEPLESFLSRA